MSSGFESLVKRVQKVNARILGIEKRYGKDSKIVKRVYHYLNLAQGTDNLTRYRTPPKGASLQYIAKFERALSKTENSAYLTKEGRANILNKARETFVKNMQYTDSMMPLDYMRNYTDAELETLYDTFLSIKDIVNAESDGWSGLVINAIDDAMASGMSSKDIIQLTQEYQKMTVSSTGVDYSLYDFIRDNIS